MQSQASFYEAVSVAAASLRGSKLRSFLTLLGVILATTTLIAVMSVIEGMDLYIAQNVSDMGADGFEIHRLIMMGHWDPKKFLELLRKNPELRRDEYQFLKERLTMVSEIGIEARRRETAHHGKEQVENVRVQGATPNISVITNTQVAEGRYIADFDNHRRGMVAVIGNDLKEKFFPTANPLAKTITVGGRVFEVIGVAKAKGSVFGNSQDNFISIPIETFFKLYGTRQGMSFAAKAVDHAHLQQAQEEARMMLRAYRHLGPKEEDNFSMVTSDSLVQFWDQLTGAIAATAVAVVSVFMVVGGVVIMNIMLAAVTERTHEIGIRKSVGARRSDILNQFLVESSMLAATGGLIGVGLAWLAAILVRNLTPVPMALPATAVAVGVGLSAIVGLFFGIYPAQRAAKLDPIEALRAEK